MSFIEIYAEFYYGKRLPTVEYFLNKKKLEPIESLLVKSFTFKDNYKIKLEVDIKQENLFEIKMMDKTDDDMLYDDKNSTWVDHYVQIKEMAIDNITFETAIYHCCAFKHSMSDEWVANIKNNQNVEILPHLKGCTEIRLNGIWHINFTKPIWKWQIENRYE